MSQTSKQKIYWIFLAVREFHVRNIKGLLGLSEIFYDMSNLKISLYSSVCLIVYFFQNFVFNIRQRAFKVNMFYDSIYIYYGSYLYLMNKIEPIKISSATRQAMGPTKNKLTDAQKKWPLYKTRRCE